MSFMRGDLLHRVAKLVKGGAMQKPRWFDAVMKVPPQPKELRCKRPPKIQYPEDPLIESYYARHPEAKLVPFSLKSFDVPIAREFAQRQLELMQDGHSKREARDITESEFKEVDERMEAEAARLRRMALRDGNSSSREQSVVEAVQEEEMLYLMRGLENTAKNKGSD